MDKNYTINNNTVTIQLDNSSRTITLTKEFFEDIQKVFLSEEPEAYTMGSIEDSEQTESATNGSTITPDPTEPKMLVFTAEIHVLMNKDETAAEASQRFMNTINELVIPTTPVAMLIHDDAKVCKTS